MSFQCTAETFRYWRCTNPISEYYVSECWQQNGAQLVNADLGSLSKDSIIVVRGVYYDTIVCGSLVCPYVTLHDSLGNPLMSIDGNTIIVDPSGLTLCIPQKDSNVMLNIYLWYMLQDIKQKAENNGISYNDIAYIKMYVPGKYDDPAYLLTVLDLADFMVLDSNISATSDSVTVYLKIGYRSRYTGQVNVVPNAVVVVKLFSEATVVGVSTCTTNSNGECTVTISGLEPGTYDVMVEVQRLLDLLDYKPVNQLHIALFYLGSVEVGAQPPPTEVTYPEVVGQLIAFIMFIFMMSMMMGIIASMF